MIPAFAALALATLADFASTVYFLRHTSLQEGNPFLRKVIERFGLPGLFVAKAASFALVLGIHLVQPLPIWLVAALAGMYLAVVVWNLYKIKESK